ncbi:hypothetical protein CL629_02740 [bacterium]|nr:hypothetical protein [bacterium]
MSNKKIYYRATSIIFLIIAAGHLLRVVKGWEAIIGGVAIPMWFSWGAVALAGYLAYRGHKLASKFM